MFAFECVPRRIGRGVSVLLAVVLDMALGGWARAARSVHHQRVRLHGRGGVVERVGVLRGLALQLALVGQRARAAVAEESGRSRGAALDSRSSLCTSYYSTNTKSKLRGALLSLLIAREDIQLVL